MSVSNFSRHAIGVGAALAILAGCGGSQSQFGATPVTPQGALIRRHSAGAAGFTVSGRNILLDGKRFFIKGVDYGPTNAGYTYYVKKDGKDVLVNDAPVANPLDNAYKGIWKADLDLMRADGVNAVKVYNVSLDEFKAVAGYNNAPSQHPSKGETGKIDEFLDAAWNGGNHPIYVVLSIFFNSSVPLDASLKKTYSDFYRIMDKKYGAKPAVMGVSISSEINAADNVRNPRWWEGFNTIDAAAKEGFKQSGNAHRITTTTFVDGTTSASGKIVVEAPYFGTKYKSTNDTWGLDIYRGPHLTRTGLWQQIEDATTKPVMLGEYGSPSGRLYLSTAVHGPQGHCINYPMGEPGTTEDVEELPNKATANPNMQNLADYVTGNQQDIFANYSSSQAVISGGFYFEFSDEWWKAGWSRMHVAGFNGRIPKNDQFAPCYNNEGWYGLYIDKPVNAKVDSHGNLEDQPYPNGRQPDERVPRQPVVDAIAALWKAEQ